MGVRFNVIPFHINNSQYMFSKKIAQTAQKTNLSNALSIRGIRSSFGKYTVKYAKGYPIQAILPYNQNVLLNLIILTINSITNVIKVLLCEIRALLFTRISKRSHFTVRGKHTCFTAHCMAGMTNKRSSHKVREAVYYVGNQNSVDMVQLSCQSVSPVYTSACFTLYKKKNFGSVGVQGSVLCVCFHAEKEQCLLSYERIKIITDLLQNSNFW